MSGGGADDAGRAIIGNWFEADLAQVLAPELRRGDAVIMDNLSSYKRAAVKEKDRSG